MRFCLHTYIYIYKPPLFEIDIYAMCIYIYICVIEKHIIYVLLYIILYIYVCIFCVCMTWNSGVTRWYEFNEKMKNQHRRIIDAVGEDAFMAESINKFPLVLDDASMFEVATPLGWQQAWVSSKAKAAFLAKASSGGSGEIAAVLAKAGPAPGAVAPPPPVVRSSGVAPSPASLPSVVSSDVTRAPLPTPARTLIPPPVVKPAPMTAPPRVVSPGGPVPVEACKNQFVFNIKKQLTVF